MIEFYKHIRDPIHGFIGLTKEEIEILDTPQMQRLRRIKQLANAHLLYPGANHTRFEHSLGSMNIAYRMGDKIQLSQENMRLLRIVVLLHDIAHGPYSHPFEDAMQELGKNYDHDIVRIDVINNESIIIDKDLKNDVIRFLCYVNGDRSAIDENNESHLEWNAMKMILSSPLDCDKMDYLLRDGYFCGVNYSKFDLERILLKIGYIPDNPYKNKLLTIDINGADAASMVTISRLMMNRQVYLHKLRAISDLMTKRMISLASNHPSFLSTEEGYDIYKKFEGFSDYSLIDHIINNKYDDLTTFYAKSIKDRHLFKLIKKINIDEMSATGKDNLIDLLKKKKERRTFFSKKEIMFGSILKIDPKLVIIDYHESHVKKPTGEIYVRDGSKRLSLSDISPINMEDEDKREMNIYVLVPSDNRDNALEKIHEIDF